MIERSLPKLFPIYGRFYSVALCLGLLGCEPDRAQPAPLDSLRAVQQGVRLTPERPLSIAPSTGSRTRRLLQHACQPWRSIAGEWLSHGYGLALHATDDTFAIYDVSEHSCFEEFHGSLAEACKTVVNVDLGGEEEPFRVVVRSEVFGPVMRLRDSGTMRYWFSRTAALPAPCETGTAPTEDPIQNFDLFWEHMNEHYAFFRLRGVDWQAARARYRPLVTEATTPDALFGIMTEMLEPLRDYHVSLASADSRYSRQAPAEIIENAEGINAYLGEHYLLAPGTRITGNGLLAYRQLNDDVGYVMILGMANYASADVLRASEDAIQSEVDLAGQAIDEALSALSVSRSLIVDVRFNTGGFDAVSLALAGRFADRSRLSWSKVARAANGYTWPERFNVKPTGEANFAGDVVVLTSQITLSAAETFVLAMRVLPNVKVIGERTAGAHSDVMTRSLPNGWQLGLSNEVYTAADGRVYEGVGIPPDRHVALEPASFAQGRDAIAEAARAYLASFAN